MNNANACTFTAEINADDFFALLMGPVVAEPPTCTYAYDYKETTCTTYRGFERGDRFHNIFLPVYPEHTFTEACA